MQPTAHNWKKVNPVSVTGTESWFSLPIEVTLSDIPVVQLSQDEVDLIEEYSDKYFPREVMDAGKFMYPNAKGAGKPNPNARGIRGELAVLRHFAPHLSDIIPFLGDRPWKMRDMGDAIIIGRQARIFDAKTRARKATPDVLLSDDTWMAELDAKFLDRSRYGYLQCFVFCASNLAENQVYLMGWMSIEEFEERCQRFVAGNTVPHAGMPYYNDSLCIPYRRLHPITQLSKADFYPITAQMTLDMREDYDVKRIRPIDGKKYISAFSV